MIKWLLVIGVIAFVYYAFIKKSAPLEKSRNEESSKKGDEEVEDLVECAKCGVFVEIDEAIVSNGKYYCSKECLRG